MTCSQDAAFSESHFVEGGKVIKVFGIGRALLFELLLGWYKQGWY